MTHGGVNGGSEFAHTLVGPMRSRQENCEHTNHLASPYGSLSQITANIETLNVTLDLVSDPFDIARPHASFIIVSGFREVYDFEHESIRDLGVASIAIRLAHACRFSDMYMS